MDPGRLVWLFAAYATGTIPSAHLVARIAGGNLLAEADRRSSAGDAHMLLKQAGGPWGAIAATLDVVKGFAFALVARHAGDLPDAWTGACGAALVLGYTFPPYARATAGRGLAAGAGVLLALLPVEMAIAGVVIVAGYVAKTMGPATTIGFASIPVVAAVRGQPAPLAAMGVAVFGLIVLRRLEGVGPVAERYGWPRAVALRTVLDTDQTRADRRASTRRSLGPDAA